MPGLLVSLLHHDVSSFLTEGAKQNRFPEGKLGGGLSARHRWTALGCVERDRRGKPQAS